MDNCLFCKIARGEFASAKIWEDEEFVSILDASPNTKGMALVMPKKHYESYVFSMPDDVYQRFLLVTKTVAKKLEKALGVKRVAMVMEGMGVNHSHIKLYPMHGLDDEFKEMQAKDQIFFRKYPGYITTVLGPRVNLEELKKIAEEIKKAM